MPTCAPTKFPPPADRRPPYHVPGPASRPWREEVLVRVAELRFLLAWFQDPDGGRRTIPSDAATAIEAHLQAAEQAALPNGGIHNPIRILRRGSTGVARAFGHIDAAEVSMLRLAPATYVIGQLPSLLAQARSHLPEHDPRLERMEALATAHGPSGSVLAPAAPAAPVTPATRRKSARYARVPITPPPDCGVTLCQADRDAILSAHRAGAMEGRREIARVRSFRNILLLAALALTIGALGLIVVAVLQCQAIPLCFSAQNSVVCPLEASQVTKTKTPSNPAVSPTQGASPRVDEADAAERRATSSWDIPLIELLGLLGAALAGARALRALRGTSTPFGLPIAVIVLKLPAGALTAVLGLLLLRGEFVPGFSALDTPGQILAWGVALGYAQQIFTRLIDEKAQNVLEEVGTPGSSKATEGSASSSGAGAITA
jgi:hypothetical protein